MERHMKNVAYTKQGIVDSRIVTLQQRKAYVLLFFCLKNY